MKPTMIAMPGEQAQALGHLPHPLVSKRRTLWNRVLCFLHIKFSVPPRPKWSIETGSEHMPLDEQMHVQRVADMPLKPIGPTPEGTTSARRILEAQAKLGL